MFEVDDPELAAWLVDVPEPDWLDHPVYSSMVFDAERVAELRKLAPAARPTGELARLDVHALPPAARIDLLTMLDEQANWLESLKVGVIAELGRSDSTKLGLSQEVVSLALSVPPRTAQHKLAAASTLTRELPRTLQLLASGKISGRHAQLITEASWRLTPDLLDAFEARVTENAAELTAGQLHRVIRRVSIALEPATAEQRHQRAAADRKVGLQSCDDGMVQLPVLLPAADGQAIFTRLTAAAKLLPAEDVRTMDQKRADLLVDAVLSGIPYDALPRLQGRKPSIQVVVGADTLLELDDQPAELSGYGPITAETARRLAADESGTWRRLLTDPDSGCLLDISQDHYQPSQRLRDYVSARDGVCCFPHCNQPGYRCEYEHIVPYLQGGQTCRCNGALACKRHNLCKIDSGWQYRLNADSSFSWISDTGHEYLGHPPERWGRSTEPDRQPEPSKPTISDWWAQEDAAYQRVQQRQQAALSRALRSADQRAIDRARGAIETTRRQFERELARRATHPDEPF